MAAKRTESSNPAIVDHGQRPGFWRAMACIIALCFFAGATKGVLTMKRDASASTTNAQTPRNRYDDALDELLNPLLALPTSMRGGYGGAQTFSPDDEAEMERVERLTGVPRETSERISAGSPSSTAYKPSVRRTPPSGFSGISLEGGVIYLEVPSSWRQGDSAKFQEAQSKAASLMGKDVGRGESIFLIADAPVVGMKPAATINVLSQPGPTATQGQMRQLLTRKDPGLSDMKNLVAAEFSAAAIPNVKVRVVGSEWADNGTLLCLHVKTEAAIGEARRITHFWKCPNSSRTVTLIGYYNAPDAAYYEPVLKQTFGSLRLAVDPVIRLR